MTRRTPEDIVHIGNIISHLMKGEFWGILAFTTASRRVLEIEKSRNGVGGNISAERVLGRIEAYESVVSDLEAFAALKDELQKPVEGKSRGAEEGAEELIDREDVSEPVALNYGGAV